MTWLTDDITLFDIMKFFENDDELNSSWKLDLAYCLTLWTDSFNPFYWEFNLTQSQNSPT